ncbi:MAG TPA: trehalase family glycosidase [Acidothermaceae bacterium]
MDTADRTAPTKLAATSPAPSARARFDIAEIPFSRRGSWLDLSPVVGLHKRENDIHLVSHSTAMTPVLALIPSRADGPVGTTIDATPSRLTWQSASGTIEAAFETTTTIRLRGRGIGLLVRASEQTLTPFTGTYLFQDPATDAWVFTSYETGRRYRVSLLAGELRAVGAEAIGQAPRELSVGGAASGDWELAIEELRTSRRPYLPTSSFDDVVAEVSREFDDYLEAIARWRTAATPAAALAAYVLWSATVEPAGFVGREAVLMSKHWMDSVWSWDHCFNAIALARGLPEHALDQFLLPFDHQDESGALPDSVTHSKVLHNFVKPPIHGWALRRIRDVLPTDLDRAELELCYERLAKWSSFWLDHRVGAGRTLPSYQHGNDSGWDNSTVFDQDRVVESADLASFLAIQLDVLAELAKALDRPDDALRWSAASTSLTETMVSELWDGLRFTTYAPLSGRRGASQSLLSALPIVAGTSLPRSVLDALARQIGELLTEYGPATEPTSSGSYQPDGYWRGPIWAPSTLLVEDGLRRSGHTELANEVSARFRRLCEQSGFAENFDAMTGEGLRDRAYTWTAATYLVLSAEHVERVSSSR